MPRHLEPALDRLVGLAPAVAAQGIDLALWEAPACATLAGYVQTWYGWGELGLEVPAPSRRRVRALWSEHPVLRNALRTLVASYPCDEFEGPFRKMVARNQGVHFALWFERYPHLRDALRPVVEGFARQFNQPWVATNGALLWARYFDGGDEAYRAFALAFNRHDRSYKKRPWNERREDFLRHDLNDHGTITLYEAQQINAHLEKLGNDDPLDLAWVGASGWWKAAPPDDWRRPAQLGRPFLDAVRASRAFAAERWSDEDVCLYARALRALPERARAEVERGAEGDAVAQVLRLRDARRARGHLGRRDTLEIVDEISAPGEEGALANEL